MLLRLIYDDHLAQAAYLIGCERSREALIIDPERDVDRYIALAAREGMRITAVAETHIHADFLSGARELAEQTGAKVYISGEGGVDWQYRWLNNNSRGGGYDHRILKNGDSFTIGGIEIKALHTPGHTPEHLSYLVTDRASGATEPMGVFSGDFVFVGDLGRPDLLETAAGQVGAREPSARTLFQSARRFLTLPEFLQVWPAHGAGSACGKALGAVPQSTVGYEKRFNPALRSLDDENTFVRSILSGQPEPPLYFARMKRENRDGPAILGAPPEPRRLSEEDLARLDPRAVVLDTRDWSAYSAAHLPGALSAPFDKTFPTIAASYIQPSEEIILVIDARRVGEAVRDLVRTGLDRVTAYIEPETFARFAASASVSGGGAGGSSRVETTPEIDAGAFKDRMAADDVFVLDVRSESEYASGHIPGALNVVHTRLADHLAQLPKDRPIVAHCRSGVRSARATSLLRREGAGGAVER